jgi:hypothetical protein
MRITRDFENEKFWQINVYVWEVVLNDLGFISIVLKEESTPILLRPPNVFSVSTIHKFSFGILVGEH